MTFSGNLNAELAATQQVKDSARAATTASITLSGAQTIDGTSVVAGDDVLVKDQATPSQNGLYTAAAGAWTRRTDADTDTEVQSGMMVFVREGTVNNGRTYRMTTNDPVTLGSTSLSFAQLGGGGGMSIGGTVTSGTVGSLLFVGTGPVLAQDNANLFWDDTNNRLGIGTASPGSDVHISRSSTGATRLIIANANAGGAAQADAYIHNGSFGFTIATTGTGFTTSAPVMANQALWSTDTGLVNGILIQSTHATGPVVIAQGGGAAVNERLRFSSTEIVFNDPGNDYDFRVESDTEAFSLFHDASLDSGHGRWGFFDSTPDALVDIEGGTLPSTVPAFGVTATLNATPGGTAVGFRAAITSNGSAADAQVASRISLEAGYTGAGNTRAGLFENFAAGTAGTGHGTAWGDGNLAFDAITVATTTGTNFGARGRTGGGDINVGMWGSSEDGDKASAVSIGVVGSARNNGAGATRAGGHFFLSDSAVTFDGFPVFVAAALVADNGAVAAPIFLGRDNGTTVFALNDGMTSVAFGTGFDRTASGTYALFGANATTVTYGRTGQTSAFAGAVTVAETLLVTGLLNANGNIDRTTGASLSIGATTATTLSLGRSGQTQSLLGDVTIAGNLTVSGATFSSAPETVLINDNHLYLNNGYNTVAAQTGGLVANYLPTSTNDTVAGAYVAGVAATSNPTVTTTGAATFSAGDFIQLASSTNNNGLFEVLTHAANVLTIRGIGTTATVEDFTQNQFVAGSSDGATIRKINVGVKRVGTDGIWESAAGSATPLTFVDEIAGVGVANRVAYYSSTSAITSDADLTFDGTNLTTANVAFTDGGIDRSTAAALAIGATNATTLNLGRSGQTQALLGNVTVAGNTTLGDASGDAVTVNASTASIPNGLNFDSNTLAIDATNDRTGFRTAAPNSVAHVSGSFAAALASVSTTTTLDVTHYTVLGDASGAAFTITLPTAAGITGRMYNVKKTDSSANAVTVDAAGSETIDGALTQSLATQYQTITIQSDGTNWVIL